MFAAITFSAENPERKFAFFCYVKNKYQRNNTDENEYAQMCVEFY